MSQYSLSHGNTFSQNSLNLGNSLSQYLLRLGNSLCQYSLIIGNSMCPYLIRPDKSLSQFSSSLSYFTESLSLGKQHEPSGQSKCSSLEADEGGCLTNES